MTTTTKPPAEVWLQWYGNGDPADGDPEPGTVTWHPERVYDSDVGPYVLDVEGLRSRAEKAEAERDEERRQRQVESELAREAIAHLRRLAERVIPTLSACQCERPGGGDCETCTQRRDVASARAWLDGVRV